MNALKTLLWLELRSAGLWLVLLLASVIAWHFIFAAVPRFDLQEPLQYVATLGAFIAAANALGLAANTIFMFRSWQSMRNGELQFKLSSATHPGIIVLSQFLLAFLSIAVFSFAVTSLGWWHLGRLGFSLSFASACFVWFYFQISFFLPTVAFGFLLISYTAAFHLRSLAWLALPFGFLGFSKLADLSFTFLDRFGYTLLSIPLPELRFLGQVFTLPGDALEANALPQEIIWIAIVITVSCIYLSGRVLKEVEL